MNNGLSVLLIIGDMMSYDELIDLNEKAINDYKEAKLLNDLEKIKTAKQMISCNCMLIMQKSTGMSAETTINGMEKIEKLSNLVNPHEG